MISNECNTFDLIMNYWVFHHFHIWMQVVHHEGFPGGSDGKEHACSAGDTGLIPGSGRSPGEGNGYHSSILAWIGSTGTCSKCLCILFFFLNF